MTQGHDLYDLIVLGAGPAGSAAAIAAAKGGLQVCLVDDSERPGGQVFRAPFSGQPDVTRHTDHDARKGRQLRADVQLSAVEWRGLRRAWMVSEAFRVDAVSPHGNETIHAPQLICATGAYERVIPFRGWTLPGVIGLAGATILMKTQKTTPPDPIVVAGVGPLLIAVAARAIRSGARVAAIVDSAASLDWIRRTPALLTQPGLTGEGMRWILTILGHRIPYYPSHTIAEAAGQGRVERVTIAPVDRSGRIIAHQTSREIETATLSVGNGLIPGSDIPKLLGAKHRFDHLQGGWVPIITAEGLTSIPGLYAVGDGAGIKGALCSQLDGALAGLAALKAAGMQADPEFEHELQKRRKRAEPFSRAIRSLLAQRPGQIDNIENDTTVCRCEDVTRAQIEAAMDAGAHDLNELKHFTRCGMGPCQGRMCGETVAALCARRYGPRSDLNYWTPRPPLRPVPLSAVLGEFSYSDIPVPKPAPI